MGHSNIKTPTTNDPAQRQARNNNLASRLTASADDIVDIWLETTDNGSKTRWHLVVRGPNGAEGAEVMPVDNPA